MNASTRGTRAPPRTSARPAQRALPGALWLALVLGGTNPACSPEAGGQESLATRLDASLQRAVAYLVQHQDEDGAWRSGSYSVLRDGAALTPMVAKALLLAAAVPGSTDARARALAYVGGIDPAVDDLAYPVYTASLIAILLGHSDDPAHVPTREAWVDLLHRFQLGEALGWGPDDPAYGGWGYAPAPLPRAAFDPRRGSAFDADLSSTLFALGALRLAGAGTHDPALVRALTFVERCQNFGDDARFDDGGFFMAPTNEVQNKAGVAGTDAAGVRRYRSYGSMTADGLRALLRCGLPPGHPRVRAARAWLERHFSAATNPGAFVQAREVDRDAAYYYYCWSFAHAMTLLDVHTVESGDGPISWARTLSHALIDRQAPDGSWSNTSTAMKEDDPLVATSLALAALELCRRHQALE